MLTCLMWIFGFQIDSVEQPVKSNSVGSGHVSYYWTSALDDNLYDTFVIFKDVQLRFIVRRMCVGGHIIHSIDQPSVFF